MAGYAASATSSCARSGRSRRPRRSGGRWRILELIVKRSRALVEARVMVLALRERDELVIRATSGEVDRSQQGLAIPLQDSLSAHVDKSGQPRRLSDAAPGVRALLPKAFDAHTALVVPLRFRGQGLGVLAAVDRLNDGPEFSAEDERLMTAFATSAATAVATARDVAAHGLRRSLEAAERERSRWARELHDQTLQDLAGLKVMLSGARRAKDREQVDRVLEQAIEHAQLGVDALRGLVTELRPAALDELGPGPALRALIDRTAATTGLAIDLNIDLAYEEGRADTRHAPELESTMYRLVQAALTNVVKHAGASRVTVAVIEDNATVQLSVTDDGAGFQTDAATEGFGLIGMRERVALSAASWTSTRGPARAPLSPHGYPSSGARPNPRYRSDPRSPAAPPLGLTARAGPPTTAARSRPTTAGRSPSLAQ
jgi:signal transduction histidine kinase